MGYALSWLAVEGEPSETVLERAGLQSTAAFHNDSEVPLCFACLPTGWTVLFARDIDFASDERLAEMSRGNWTVVGFSCDVDDDALYSRAAGFRDGRPVWRLIHDNSQAPRHLESEGTLPDGFYDIRNRMDAEQTQNDAGDADSDFFFDIPVEVAAAMTGYRYDQSDCEGEAIYFTDAEPIDGSQAGSAPQPWWRKNPFGESE